MRFREQKLYSYFEIVECEPGSLNQLEKFREESNDYDMEAELWLEWIDILRHGTTGFKRRVLDKHAQLIF